MVGTAGGVPWRVTSGNHSSQSTGSGTPAVGWGAEPWQKGTHRLRPQCYFLSVFFLPAFCRDFDCFDFENEWDGKVVFVGF